MSSEQMVKKYIAELVGGLVSLQDGISDYLQKLNHLSCVVHAALNKSNDSNGKIAELRERLHRAMGYVYHPKALPFAWVEASKIEEELIELIFEKDLIDYSALYDFQTKLNEKWKKRGGGHES
ncbi:hypothetical protein [Geoglobus ahangari]